MNYEGFILFYFLSILLYLAFIRFKNFKLKSIFICLASIKLYGTLNLNESSYILPLLDFITMSLHDFHMFCLYQIMEL
jgi:hypothetical protein